jgi:hypothetical protein
MFISQAYLFAPNSWGQFYRTTITCAILFTDLQQVLVPHVRIIHKTQLQHIVVIFDSYGINNSGSYHAGTLLPDKLIGYNDVHNLRRFFIGDMGWRDVSAAQFAQIKV